MKVIKRILFPILLCAHIAVASAITVAEFAELPAAGKKEFFVSGLVKEHTNPDMLQYYIIALGSEDYSVREVGVNATLFLVSGLQDPGLGIAIPVFPEADKKQLRDALIRNLKIEDHGIIRAAALQSLAFLQRPTNESASYMIANLKELKSDDSRSDVIRIMTAVGYASIKPFTDYVAEAINSEQSMRVRRSLARAIASAPVEVILPLLNEHIASGDADNVLTILVGLANVHRAFPELEAVMQGIVSGESHTTQQKGLAQKIIDNGHNPALPRLAKVAELGDVIIFADGVAQSQTGNRLDFGKQSEDSRVAALQRVYAWPLAKKVSFLAGDNVGEPNATEAIVRTALRAELLGAHSQVRRDNLDQLAAVRDTMERIRPYVFKLGESASSEDMTYAIEFGRYLHVDEPVAAMFYAILDRSAGGDKTNVTSALDAIFTYHLETTELKAELLKGLTTDEQLTASARYGRVAELWSGAWGFEESLYPLMSLVEVQYAANGTINRSALKSIKELGVKRADIHERLKCLLEKVNEKGGTEFRAIESIRFALILTKPE